jgi:hypothetical protein
MALPDNVQVPATWGPQIVDFVAVIYNPPNYHTELFHGRHQSQIPGKNLQPEWGCSLSVALAGSKHQLSRRHALRLPRNPVHHFQVGDSFWPLYLGSGISLVSFDFVLNLTALIRRLKHEQILDAQTA